MASRSSKTMEKRAATFTRKTLRSSFLCLTLLLCGLPIYAATAAPGAQSDSEEKSEYSEDVIRRASSIARQTMSPFCPGRTLSDCPSEYATEWRSDIRKMVAAGLTADQIQAELEKRAGDNLSGIPNRESSYILPISLSVAAALVLYFVFARLRRPEDKVADTKSKKAVVEKPPSAVDDNRLEAELDRED
jgi:cytochrome c-type biogenesis protein CcmH/NrfF